MGSVMKDLKENGFFISLVVAVLVIGAVFFVKYQMNVSECETYQEVTGYETKMVGRHCYSQKDGQWDLAFDKKGL